MSPAPSVGIVAVNYNSAAFVGEFAESLRPVRYPNFRLIVVDSASTDGSADELARLVPDAVLLRSDENLGTAAGNNRGIAYCLEHAFDYVLLLNNDTVLTEDFLERLVAAAGERTLAVPKILYYYDRRLISTHAGDFDWRRGVFRHTFHGRPDSPAASTPRELETASFCCALVPAAAFREVGLLDERFFMYYEETDWLRQARDRGYRLLYRPEAVIYHRESASSGPPGAGWMTPFKHHPQPPLPGEEALVLAGCLRPLHRLLPGRAAGLPGAVPRAAATPAGAGPGARCPGLLSWAHGPYRGGGRPVSWEPVC